MSEADHAKKFSLKTKWINGYFQNSSRISGLVFKILCHEIFTDVVVTGFQK